MSFPAVLSGFEAILDLTVNRVNFYSGKRNLVMRYAKRNPTPMTGWVNLLLEKRVMPESW